MLGWHGDKPPEIGTATHTLWFRISLGFLEMNDAPLDPSYIDSHEISPFTLLLLIKQNNEKISDDIEIRNC